MTSQDIYAIAQDEQAFRVYVIQKLDNHEVRLNQLVSRLDRVEQSQAEFQQAVTKRLDTLEFENRILGTKVDGLQTSVYWGFALMGIIISLLQLFPRRTEKIPQPESASQPQPIFIQLPEKFIEREEKSA